MGRGEPPSWRRPPPSPMRFPMHWVYGSAIFPLPRRRSSRRSRSRRRGTSKRRERDFEAFKLIQPTHENEALQARSSDGSSTWLLEPISSIASGMPASPETVVDPKKISVWTDQSMTAELAGRHGQDVEVSGHPEIQRRFPAVATTVGRCDTADSQYGHRRRKHLSEAPLLVSAP